MTFVRREKGVRWHVLRPGAPWVDKAPTLCGRSIVEPLVFDTGSVRSAEVCDTCRRKGGVA